jgi:lycopene beta-cyclase
MNKNSVDIIFAGGGLAATLAAYRLVQTRPDLRILVVEAGGTLGGNHTWSFHDTDVTREAHEWIAPFVAHRWPAQEVRFPLHSRIIPVGYNTIFSETLHQAASALLKDRVLFGRKVRHLNRSQVVLDNGDTLDAACVVDARGFSGELPLTLAYQKFVGLEVRLKQPHGQTHPIIMDAALAQHDGYRFVYTLPFSSDTILIEDTYYSNSASLDHALLRQRCLDYAKQRGWEVLEALRQEHGVLPLVLGGDLHRLITVSQSGAPSIGLRAGIFHYTTSYSFPLAVMVAERIAALQPLTGEALRHALIAWTEAHWQSQRMFRLLNRMLFAAAEPSKRYRVLERFYRLPQPIIEGFYKGQLTLAQQARILVGKPPVPVLRALKVLTETGANRVLREKPAGAA